jgi:hypothetical protein
MKKAMMKKMMPLMSGTIEKMEFSEKEHMMGTMMPHMMANMSTEEKLQMMQKMMPIMMKDMDMTEMQKMMDTMMPLMMDQMQKKGINMIDMMGIMCPKCVAIATSQASNDEKQKLKAELTELVSNI